MSYWRWFDTDLLTVYALVNEKSAYVGVTKYDVNKRANGHDHKNRRDWQRLTLQTNIDPEHGHYLEQVWTDKFREMGYELASRDWFDVCREAGVAGGKAARANEKAEDNALVKAFKALPAEQRKARAFKASMAAREKQAYLAASAAAAKTRKICSCGFESNAAGIARHRKSSGHD